MNTHRLPSGIYVAEEPKTDDQRRSDRAKAEKDYYDEHDRCPKCGGSNLLTTCMGFDIQHGGEDRNFATCGCGWHGRVHDLVPKSTAGIYAFQTIAYNPVDLLMGTWTDDEEDSTCTNDADS